MSRRLQWGLVVGAALISGMLTYSYLQSINRTVSVWAAASDLPAYTILRDQDLMMIEVPAGAEPTGRLTGRREAVGRPLLAPVVEGEVLVDHQLGAAGSIYQNQLEPGERAFFVPSQDGSTSLSGGLTAGQLIDLIYVGDGSETEAEAGARFLMEEIRVLESRMDPDHGMVQDGYPPGFVVAVTAVEAEQLASALSYGNLYVVERRQVERRQGGTLP